MLDSCVHVRNEEAVEKWLPKGSWPPKKFKPERSAMKVYAAVFWEAEGALLINFQPHKVSQNSEHVIGILWKPRQAIKVKRPGKLSCKVLYLHDNARPWTLKITKAILVDFM